MAENSIEFSNSHASITQNFDPSSFYEYQFEEDDFYVNQDIQEYYEAPEQYLSILDMIDELMQYPVKESLNCIKRKGIEKYLQKFCPYLNIYLSQQMNIDQQSIDSIKMLLILQYIMSIAQFRCKKDIIQQFQQPVQELVNELAQNPKQFYYFVNQIQSLLESFNQCSSNFQQGYVQKLQILSYVLVLLKGIDFINNESYKIKLNLGYISGLVQNVLLRECTQYCNHRNTCLDLQEICISILIQINKINPKYQLSIDQQQDLYPNLSEMANQVQQQIVCLLQFKQMIRIQLDRVLNFTQIMFKSQLTLKKVFKHNRISKLNLENQIKKIL